MISKAVSLGLAIYRVTKQFPAGEVLIGQLRQMANEVVKELTLNRKTKAIFKIKVVLNYLDISQKQQWTKELNFVILKREYSQLLEQLKDKLPVAKQAGKQDRITGRQKRIFLFVKQKQPAPLKEIAANFNNFNERTIRRDLADLIKQKYLSRQGQGKKSFYQINKDI